MQRRGVSQIIGTLMMAVIVVSVGTVLLFQGMGGINSFNNTLSTFLINNKDSSLENLTIEHVRFDPLSQKVSIWVRNTGTVDLSINTITVVRIDNQELIVNWNNVNTQVSTKNYKQIDIGILGANIISMTCSTPTIPPPASAFWNTGTCSSYSYDITLTTKRGNSFEMVAQPYNT
jgi:hypothetical protein